MTAREWQPGDVAMVAYDDRPERPMMRVVYNDVDQLAWIDGDYKILDRHDRVQSIRPLVVIDPEDRDAAFRLLSLWFGHVNATVSEVAKFQNCLRGFANPTPPKPEEPTGLGAVVEDAEGNRWVRVWNHLVAGRVWTQGLEVEGAPVVRDYVDITAVRALSEGVL